MVAVPLEEKTYRTILLMNYRWQVSEEVRKVSSSSKFCSIVSFFFYSLTSLNDLGNTTIYVRPVFVNGSVVGADECLGFLYDAHFATFIMAHCVICVNLKDAVCQRDE